MLSLNQKTKEVDIELTYSETLGGKVKLYLTGTGDLSHHLIEETFLLLDKLARIERVSHQSREYKDG